MTDWRQEQVRLRTEVAIQQAHDFHRKKSEEARALGLKSLPNPIIRDQPELVTPTYWKVRVEFVWRDIWFGVFVSAWKRDYLSRWRFQRTPFYDGGSIHIDAQKTYVCIIPYLPIVITRTREIEKPYYSK